MGRPMGIPKTGVFGLYDLIGIDLMSDVVDTLGTILPENDAFHKVGAKKIPLAGLIKDMIENGYTGNKGKGGFYRSGENENDLFLDIRKNTVLKKSDGLNNKAKISAELIEKGQETLFHLTRNNSNDDSEKKYTKFCRRVLGRVLHLSLIHI